MWDNIIKDKVAIPADGLKTDTNDASEKIKPLYLSNEHSGKLLINF